MDYPNNLQFTTLYPLDFEKCGRRELFADELKVTDHICAYRPNIPSVCDVKKKIYSYIYKYDEKKFFSSNK